MPEACLSCCLPPSFPFVVPAIAQKEGSGGSRPEASQSLCVGGQCLTSCVSL